MSPRAALLFLALAAGLVLVVETTLAQTQMYIPYAEPIPDEGEFHFIRMEYSDFRGGGGGFFGRRGRFGGRGWWAQDWPEADVHFEVGLRRLTRIDVGKEDHMSILDDRVFDYPYIYATQTGYWDLSDEETDRLRDYLLRGGFLVTDDFHGPSEWAVFEESMTRTFPDRPIEELDNSTHPMMHVHYDINERTFIPGLRHLYRTGGGTVARPEYTPPHWRAIHDEDGHMVVAINFNMDVGDAWEHADWPEYPEEMTRLAYFFGINYIIYTMTH